MASVGTQAPRFYPKQPRAELCFNLTHVCHPERSIKFALAKLTRSRGTLRLNVNSATTLRCRRSQLLHLGCIPAEAVRVFRRRIKVGRRFEQFVLSRHRHFFQLTVWVATAVFGFHEHHS